MGKAVGRAPLETIRFFEVAGRHQSFAKAARELGVTSGAVAHRVRKLEQYLGVELFERRSHGLALSARGQAFLIEVQDTLSAFDDSAERFRAGAKDGALKLVAVEAFAEMWLMPRLAAFRSAHPEIVIEFETSLGDHHEVDPARRGFDVWIAFVASVPPTLQSEVLFEETLVPVCSPAFLASRGRPEQPADLHGWPLLYDLAWDDYWAHWFASREAGAPDLSRASGFAVEPDGDGDVTIALAATSDCNASDAICTSGGLALTGVPAALTVPGPDADDGNGVATAGALTASFGGMPDAHEGPGELFTFQLTFSEAPDVGYVTLRDHAFAVSGGKVETAVRREQGSNLGWTITVEPDGWGDVRIALPGSRPCTSTHAICTSDDRRLSSLLDATVQGPVGLSVADASVQEGSGATLDFAVTLSRAATATVTVDYATSNGTATAGADYTATSGKLTFDPGETEQTVNVTVLDDVHDDGGETLTLTLSNATGARIADATATGTIENSDPIPAAWLARFGRTVADHVVDAIGERLTGSPGGGSQVTLGGQRIPLDGVPGGAGNDTSSGGTDGSDARETAAADTLAAFADRKSNDGAGTAWVNWGGFGGEDAAKRPASRSLSERELLLGSSFQLSLGGGDANGTGTAWTAWGRAASSSFDGEADGLSLDGDVTTFTLGADAVRGRWLGGVALAHSTGEGGFRDHADTDHPDRGSGELESTLTSVHPYLRLQASERLSLWGILGYGTGDLTLAVDAAGDRPRQTWKTGTEMWMAATGARGVLLSAADHDGFELAARGDARLVRMNSDAATGADGAGKLAATESQTSRLRFILEGSHRIELAGEQTLTPSLEVGLRQDGGDAETGTGVELGGGVSYADPALGLTVTAKARGLLAHEDADYTEWGASGSVKIDPGASGRGLSLSLSPAWGAESGGAERLWGLRDARGLAGNENFEPAGRLDSEAGWGFGAFGGRGVMTPFAGLSLSDAGERTWRSGVRWTLGPDTAFGVEGTLREAANDNEAEHGARFKFIARW